MTLQQQIRANRLRTVLLFVLFGLLVAGIGVALEYAVSPGSLIFALGFGLVYGIVSWFMAGRMVGVMTRARPIEKADNPRLYRLVENVAIAAGMAQTPAIRIVHDPAPNAFAAGIKQKDSYVAVTTGILELMDDRQLEAVIAHELAHIRNRDVRLMTLAAVLVGVIALLSDIGMRMVFFGGGRRKSDSGGGAGQMIVLVIALAALVLAPLAALGIQMAVSRRREFLADATAAETTGDAEGMALALQALDRDTSSIRDTSRSTAHMYIESPMRKAHGLRSAFSGLFATHPPIEARIKALEASGGFQLAE